MDLINVRLQKRDLAITDLLRVQGFATFDQLRNLYFPSKKICSRRLIALEEAGYISSKTADQIFRGNRAFTPYILGLNLHPLTRIYSLSQIFRKQVADTNRLLKTHLCLHQLLLNEVRENLKNEVQGFDLTLNDPELKNWSLIDAGRRKEFTPDLSFEGANFSLAIELERTMKSLNRYMERFGYFQTSSYSHVLYVYVNEGHLSSLLKYAGTSRIFAFSHYLKPTEVFSNNWGYMSLNDWVKKINSL